MTGISQPHTLKLKGNTKKSNGMVLIDIGNTHNFLDSNMVKMINIFTCPMLDMKVVVVDRKKIEKVGKFHKVKLQIQDYNIEPMFFIIPLGGVDLVLGIQ